MDDNKQKGDHNVILVTPHSSRSCSAFSPPLIRAGEALPDDLMIRIQVSSAPRLVPGPSSTRTCACGACADNDFVLTDAHISAYHLRIVTGPSRTVVEDLRSTRGTAVMTGANAAGSMRQRIDRGHRCIEHGGSRVRRGPDRMLVEVIDDDEESRVVSMRRLDEIAPVGEGLERDPNLLAGSTTRRRRSVPLRISRRFSLRFAMAR